MGRSGDDSDEALALVDDVAQHGIQESRLMRKIAPERRMTPLRLLLVVLLLVLFFVLVLAYCASLRYLPGTRTFLQVDRPLPVAVLIVLLCVYAERNRKTAAYTWFMGFGLVLCFAADIVFAASYDDRSVYGISVALTGKACYTIAFTLGVGKGAPLRMILCVPFYAFCGAVIALVYTKVEMSPVLFIIDSFVTSTMGWRALALTSGFPGSDRAKLLLWLSVVGAALWMCSETLRTVNTYHAHLGAATYLVPATYYLAQLACTFSVPRRLTRSDYWLDNFTALIDDTREALKVDIK